MMSLEFFIVIILPVALWPWGRLCLSQKWVPGIFPGGKGGRCVRLTTLPSSCAECLKIWEPQTPGTLRACPGLQWDSFTCFVYTQRQISIHETKHLFTGHLIAAKYYGSYIAILDRLCGLMVRVSGYRYRGPGFDPRRYHFLVVVGSGTGPTQPREPREVNWGATWIKNVAAPSLENRD